MIGVPIWDSIAIGCRTAHMGDLRSFRFSGYWGLRRVVEVLRRFLVLQGQTAEALSPICRRVHGHFWARSMRHVC